MVGHVSGDPSSAPFLLRPTDTEPGRPTHVIVADRTSPLGPLPTAVADAFHSAAHEFASLWEVEVWVLEPEDVFAGLGDPDLDWFTPRRPSTDEAGMTLPGVHSTAVQNVTGHEFHVG